MQKISVSAPDSTMEAIDAETKRLGVSRSHFVAEAIDFYIGSGRNLKKEIYRLNEELMIKTEEANHYLIKYYSWKNVFLPLKAKVG